MLLFFRLTMYNVNDAAASTNEAAMNGTRLLQGIVSLNIISNLRLAVCK